MKLVELCCGPARCRLSPSLGGSVLSLEVDGAQVLRPSPAEGQDVLATACFPLVPFANRIAGGRFVFRGRGVALPADPEAPPHAHHGQGWRRSWSLAGSDGRRARLSLLHERDEWPWRYVAEQEFSIAEDGLDVLLSLRNLDEAAMPAGLGLHPFFPRAPGMQLTLEADERLLSDADGLPCASEHVARGARSIDDLDGWDNLLPGAREASVAWSGGITRLVAERSAGMHVYVPAKRDYLCVEPVTHAPDSFRHERPGEVLGPGAAMSLRMSISHVPR